MNKVEVGDCLEIMRRWAEEGVQVHCCVTSPPYWGLRDYGVEGQIGLEPTPDEYVANMVEVFRCVREILRDDGTVWLNLGDSYCHDRFTSKMDGTFEGTDGLYSRKFGYMDGVSSNGPKRSGGVFKTKDLMGIPWRVAFALQADGWYLRQDIIWHKPNPMPESCKDRCTKAHEYIFLLSKSAKYYYDADAIREDSTYPDDNRKARQSQEKYDNQMGEKGARISSQINPSNGKCYPKRNRRSVWTVTTKPYPNAHFATFPPKLIEPCILAGCPEGGIVLDPFMGSGTTAEVASYLNCQYLGCELNPEYLKLQGIRVAGKSRPLFSQKQVDKP